MEKSKVRDYLMNRIDESMRHMQQETSVDGVCDRFVQFCECADIALGIYAITGDESIEVFKRGMQVRRAAMDTIYERIAHVP